MIEINDNFALLKKYAHKTVEVLRNDLNKDFSICTLDHTSLSLVRSDSNVSMIELDSLFSNGKRCYGYYNRAVPLHLTVDMHHDDLPKQKLVFDILVNVVFQPDNNLANLLALIPEKDTWTIGDFSKYFSSCLKNELTSWLFERTADTSLHNLLELQDAAFLGEDGKLSFNNASFVPSYTKFDCVKITVSREAELSSTEKAYKKLEDKLRLKAAEKGISPEIVNDVINASCTLSEAEMLLNELATAVAIADEFCVKLSIVRALMEEYPGITDVKRVLKERGHRVTDEERFIEMAKWISEETGLSYDKAKEMVISKGNRKKAEEAAKDYVLKFKKVIEYKEKFDLDSFDAAEAEIDRYGGWQKAFRRKNNKTFFRALLILLVSVGLLFAYREFINAYRTFSFRITNCDPIAIENIVRKHKAAFSYDAASRTYKFRSFVMTKAKIIDDLKADGYQVNTSAENPAEYAVTAALNKYSVRFMTYRADEFEKVKGWLKANQNIKLIDAQLNKSGFGMNIGVFKVESTVRSVDDLKESLVVGIRPLCPGLDEKNIKVTNR